jgi:hypothetical protein
VYADIRTIVSIGALSPIRQDRAARGEEIFRPKGPGPAVDTAVALFLKFPAASGRKSCFEKAKTPILGSKGGHRLYIRGSSRYERDFCSRNSKE